MYKFADKKNREDIIALRWPRACLSCGNDVAADASPQYAILGLFHVDKRTTRDDKRHTQVLLKMPGFFFVCEACTEAIRGVANGTGRMTKVQAETFNRLQESPWMEFFELEKGGCVRLPEGRYKQKLQEANPDAVLKTKASPLKAIGLDPQGGGFLE